ncbi:MAG: hypothetical protein QXL14_02600 [Candidatus Aenigmatarchaeota archaeon]
MERSKINTEMLSSTRFKLEIRHSITKTALSRQHIMNSAGKIGRKEKLKRDKKICESKNSEDFINIIKNCDSEDYKETEALSIKINLFKLNAWKGE